MKRILILSAGLIVMLMLASGASAQSVEMNSAKLYKKQGEFDKAIEWFEKAVEKKPENAEAHYMLGDLYGMKGRIAEMVREFDASLSYSKKYEKDIKISRDKYFRESFKVGVDAANAGDYTKALEAFNNALLIEPNQVDTYKNLVFVYSRLDSIPGMMQVYEELLKVEPNDYESHLALAGLHSRRQEYDKTIERLRKAVEIAPDSAKPRIIGEIGITYDLMGKGEEAMKTYQEALQMSPGNKDLLFNLGRLYFMRDDYANAVKQFTEVWKNNPDDFEVTYQVGASYLKIGERLDKKAREIEEELLSAKTATKAVKDAKTARIDSLRQVAGENFKVALPYLLRAVIIKPDQPSAWNNLGVGYMRNGQTENSKEAFDIADNTEAQDKLNAAVENAKTALAKYQANQ
ncbi:tetratricopeptide repeat protein [candidate division KSB1 bacterium]|nr:tetratricopeptide repeat protein [candidate division KSB1 bacterium]